MSFSFSDIPRFVAPEIYLQAIERMVDRLKALPGVVAVYQVGGVTTPGISDIDFFVVFEDKVRVEKNPLENLSVIDNYLFTHNLFGTSESFVNEIEQYTYFGGYKLLSGRDQGFKSGTMHADEEHVLKKQIALEYLVKAYITSSIEQAYHTIKLRNLFLHAKALMIDLSFIGIEDGKLKKAISELINARNTWFQHSLNHENLSYLAKQFQDCLYEELQGLLSREKFYLPKESNLRISRNIQLKPSEKFSVSSRGIFFPKSAMKLHDKLPKLLNKLNEFSVQLPVQQDSMPEVVTKRHQFISEMVRYQKKYLPNFIPTAFGLNIFSEKVV